MRKRVFCLGKIRRGRSQRDEIPSITKEWVNKHRHILTPRDVEMLKVLTAFPVATVRHLYHLTPPTYLKNGQVIEPFHRCKKGEQICRDRIRRLYDYHFVNKSAPQLPLGDGTSPQYVWLDRAGYRLFDMEGRPNKTLSAEYNHHAKILDVYCTLIELERSGLLNIDYLEVCYAYKPKTAAIEPDLVACFRKGGYGYRYIIEVDNCEKREAEEVRKLEKYRDWELSGHWIREPWADLYRRKFPTVVYLFAGSPKQVSRRIKVFGEAANAVELRSDFQKTSDFENKIRSLGQTMAIAAT